MLFAKVGARLVTVQCAGLVLAYSQPNPQRPDGPSRLDRDDYDKGIKVSDAELARLNIKPAEFHGEWNYTFTPRTLDD